MTAAGERTRRLRVRAPHSMLHCTGADTRDDREDCPLLRVISFDIDGTMEVGDPPGTIPVDVMRRALELGFVVGSCSDRPLSFQQALWAEHGVEVHFTVLKQHLTTVREQFAADHYLHIGDTPIDRMMAEGAGFDFVHVIEDDLHRALTLLNLFEQLPPATTPEP